jgi:ribosome-binding protein aMBF1 (putative translation factor)
LNVHQFTPLEDIALRRLGEIMDRDQSLLKRFGLFVRSAREERGFTQKQLADRRE